MFSLNVSAYSEEIDRAISLLPVRNTFCDSRGDIPVAFLLRAADWRPLNAPWWRGKEVCIVGADYNGNFFLRHCDSSVRYWDHAAQTDRMLAPGVREFVALLTK